MLRQGSTLGASSSTASLQSSYKRAQAFRSSFKRSPRTACKSGGCSLGSGGDGGEGDDDQQVLLIAASPIKFSSADPGAVGKPLVNPPTLDQRPCQTCTGFAVASAAETAVATTMGVDVSSIKLSVVDIYFCSPKPRNCKSAALLADVLADLQARGSNLLEDRCLPYNPKDPAISGVTGGKKVCANKKCSDTNPVASQGSFSYIQLADPVSVMHFIRIGSVVTRFDIYASFYTFFSNPANSKSIYRCDSTCRTEANYKESHAITLVGYDLAEGYWLAKNSWGPNWADSGMFRIELNFPGFLMGDTWGIEWTPSGNLAQPLKETKPSNTSGCCSYKATPFDYPSRIAYLADIELSKFLADNAAIITSLDEPIAGKELLICPSGGATAGA